jgi:hypothetical protein
MLESGRLLPIPFSLLDQKTCLNVRTDIALGDFYRRLANLSERIFGPEATLRRLGRSPKWLTRLIHVFRAFGAEERRRIRWYHDMARWADGDRTFRDFFEGERTTLPDRLCELAIARMGPFYELLPAGGLGPGAWPATAASTEQASAQCASSATP